MFYKPHTEDQDRLLYQVAGEAFSQALAEANLLYTFELPLTMLVSSLCDSIAQAMQNSASHFIFALTPSRAPDPRHQLNVLGLVNRGSIRRDGQVRLQQFAVSQTMKISDLVYDQLRYGHEKCTIASSNTWILNLGMFF